MLVLRLNRRKKTQAIHQKGTRLRLNGRRCNNGHCAAGNLTGSRGDSDSGLMVMLMARMSRSGGRAKRHQGCDERCHDPKREAGQPVVGHVLS
jgi:predicted secreted protein